MNQHHCSHIYLGPPGLVLTREYQWTLPGRRISYRPNIGEHLQSASSRTGMWHNAVNICADSSPVRSFCLIFVFVTHRSARRFIRRPTDSSARARASRKPPTEGCTKRTFGYEAAVGGKIGWLWAGYRDIHKRVGGNHNCADPLNTA